MKEIAGAREAEENISSDREEWAEEKRRLTDWAHATAQAAADLDRKRKDERHKEEIDATDAVAAVGYSEAAEADRRAAWEKQAE